MDLDALVIERFGDSTTIRSRQIQLSMRMAPVFAIGLGGGGAYLLFSQGVPLLVTAAWSALALFLSLLALSLFGAWVVRFDSGAMTIGYYSPVGGPRRRIDLRSVEDVGIESLKNGATVIVVTADGVRSYHGHGLSEPQMEALASAIILELELRTGARDCSACVCPSCGGDFNVDANQQVGRCRTCGLRQFVEVVERGLSSQTLLADPPDGVRVASTTNGTEVIVRYWGPETWRRICMLVVTELVLTLLFNGGMFIFMPIAMAVGISIYAWRCFVGRLVVTLDGEGLVIVAKWAECRRQRLRLRWAELNAVRVRNRAVGRCVIQIVGTERIELGDGITRSRLHYLREILISVANEALLRNVEPQASCPKFKPPDDPGNGS